MIGEILGGITDKKPLNHEDAKGTKSAQRRGLALIAKKSVCALLRALRVFVVQKFFRAVSG
jgi:hypothetical protein